VNREPFNHQTVKPHTFVPVLGIFTLVKNPLQINSFLTNKANFQDAQMNLTSLITVDYENIANCKLCENKANTKPIKANSKPIKANTNPIQSQSKPEFVGRLQKKQCFSAIFWLLPRTTETAKLKFYPDFHLKQYDAP